jgi:transposase
MRVSQLPNLLRRNAARPRRRPAPPASELRRERRALLRLREQKLRDLGGLSLEMYRRDSFREDLLLERCAELIGLEARIHELDVLLGAARHASGVPKTARCHCGAPLLWGSRFCATCGRPVAGEAAGGAR